MGDPPVKRSPPKGSRTRKSRRMATGVGNPVGRPSLYQDLFPAMLLEHMKGGKSFWSFAARAGVCFQTLREWVDPNGRFFKPEFSDARRLGECLLLEHDEKIQADGIHGRLMTAEVHYDGKGKETKRVAKPAKFSAASHAFLMKNRYPELYRDRQEVVLGNDKDAPLTAPAQPLEKQLEEIAVMLAQLRKLGVPIPVGLEEVAPPPAPEPDGDPEEG